MKEQASTLKEALSRYEAAQERFRSDIRADIAERDQKAVERDNKMNNTILLSTFGIIGVITLAVAIIKLGG